MTTSIQKKFNWPKAMFVVAVFLVPAGYGFITKFRELVLLTADEDGAFAIMPVVTYLTTTVGFFFLFIFAAMHGMFRNIERPKYAMLEVEAELDKAQEEADSSKNMAGDSR